MILVGDRRQHRSVTAGEPLKLLEETAGLRVAEVTEILRQQGDYKKAAKALSEGRTEEAFEELDKLGWIKQVADGDRYQQLAAAYLSAVAEKKSDGKHKSALVVSPTHAEGGPDHRRRSATGLKAQGKLGKERIIDAWVPAHLTDAQKADATEYDPGDLLQFHQNAPGYQERIAADRGRRDASRRPSWRSGSRCTGRCSSPWPSATGSAITAGGKTKDGKHRLSNGSLLTVAGIHPAWRHHRRSRLGHRPGFRPFDARLCGHQPCQPGRHGG